MQPAALPDREPERLSALRRLEVMDTPADESLERLTDLACDIFSAPIALVSLVDEHRQWFKSHVGLEVNQTPRAYSFCAHALALDSALVVENALEDVRFADNPLVLGEPHIRFYAGHPLRPLDGLAVGTLCVIDTAPRTFDAREKRLLEKLAAQVDDLLRQRKLQAELTRTARRFEALFSKSATAKIRIDRQGQIIAINPFALSLLGYEAHELLDRNIAVLTPPHIAVEHDQFIARFLSGGAPKVIGRGREVEAMHKQGHRVPVHLAVNAIHDNQGEVVEFLGVLTDLTSIYAANRRIIKEQSLLKVLHQGITDYQALMSGQGLWTFLMEALRELTDSDYALIGEVLPTDTTNALKIHAITDLSWSDSSRELMDRLRSGDMMLTRPDTLLGRVYAHGEVVMTNDVYGLGTQRNFPHGHPRLDNYLGVPIISGDRLIGMYAIANSKQPLNQTLLDWLQPFTDTCALLINLYRQMAEREQVTRDLAVARDLAEKASQAKSEFLSSMSHELRTPLNAIIGFAQLLSKGRRAPLDERQQRQVQQIETSGQHLLSLINEILDLARIEAGHLTLAIEPISILAVLDDACDTLEANIEAAGITLERPRVARDWRVAADPTRTKQVFLNLLSNAIKYNRPRGTIALDVVPTGEALRISVTDTGLGIDEQRRDELFEPFNRLDAEHGPIEGTGIGLAITRELVTRMQGEIGVESTPGKGSTFWFTLPLTDEHAHDEQDPKPRPEAPAAGKRRQLLYIEDNPANQCLMQDIIDDFADIELQSVTSAELALEILRHATPDLILMDIHLPGMNGFQALEALRRTPRLDATPVVALSANAMPADIDRGLAAGFNDYLTKPIDIDKLSRMLEALLPALHGCDP